MIPPLLEVAASPSYIMVSALLNVNETGKNFKNDNLSKLVNYTEDSVLRKFTMDSNLKANLLYL